MIFVVSTSANIPEQYELRKQQYLTGLQSVIKHYEINPFIVECVAKTDYLSEHFSGTTTSDNKGIVELDNLKKFISGLDLKDDDHIIKHTLRYEIISPIFLEEIKNNQYEVYCKDSSDIYGGNKGQGVHSFLISMTRRCWMEFFDIYDRNVNKDFPVEIQYTNFVKNKKMKFVDFLGIKANPWYHKKIYEV